MKTKIRTKVNCLKCSNCGDLIYSRARHDLHYCRCGMTGVDGGFDYIKGIWSLNIEPPTDHVKYLNVTKQELYDDWNHQTNKFGIVGVEGWKEPGLKK